MKHSLAGLLLCLICLGTVLCACANQRQPEPDGPVQVTSSEDLHPAPPDPVEDGGSHNATRKVPPIQSTEPVSCSFWFANSDVYAFERGYLYPRWDQEDLKRFQYLLSMEEQGDGVHCVMRKTDRYGGTLEAEFTAEHSALDRLEQMLTEQGLEENNGVYYHVDGLPEEFGCSVEVEYRSGERLSLYDNQCNRLSLEQMIAARDLFMSLMDESGVFPEWTANYSGLISHALGYAVDGTRITPEEICAINWSRSAEVWEEQFSFSLARSEGRVLLQAMVYDAQEEKWVEVEDQEIPPDQWEALCAFAAGLVPQLELDAQEEEFALDATEDWLYLEGSGGWHCECYPPSGQNAEELMSLLLELAETEQPPA